MLHVKLTWLLSDGYKHGCYVHSRVVFESKLVREHEESIIQDKWK